MGGGCWLWVCSCRALQGNQAELGLCLVPAVALGWTQDQLGSAWLRPRPGRAGRGRAPHPASTVNSTAVPVVS